MSEISLFNDYCLNLPKLIDGKKVDFVLAYIPYGATQNKWDSVIPLEEMREILSKVASPNIVISLTAQTPFDKVLGVSNIKNLRHDCLSHLTVSHCAV